MLMMINESMMRLEALLLANSHKIYDLLLSKVCYVYILFSIILFITFVFLLREEYSVLVYLSSPLRQINHDKV